MCGIVGLYIKNEKLRPKLGSLFQPMLVEMKSRGPDSAGVAIYRDAVASNQVKYSLAHDHWIKTATASHVSGKLIHTRY